MLYDIHQFKSPNYESRRQYKPIMIINHITDGTEAVRNSDEHEETAVYNTFMNPNSQASSHFTVTRDGRIKQFVDIGQAAWTQGLMPNLIQKAKNPIVRSMGVNPNLYCVSIEYDAYGDHGGDGSITEAQFWAGAWLHKYIQAEVKRLYGNTLQLNSTFVDGHYNVDPTRKPLCPGVNFPWPRLYQELAAADFMTLENYEGRLRFLQSDTYKLSICQAVMTEIDFLKSAASGSDGVASWAKSVFRTLYPVFEQQGVLRDCYSATDDFAGFWNDTLYLYNCSAGQNGPESVEWAVTALCSVYPFMLSQGLVVKVA